LKIKEETTEKALQPKIEVVKAPQPRAVIKPGPGENDQGAPA